MKGLIFFLGFVLLLSSCSLFKNRSVNKQSSHLDSTRTYDSTAYAKWKEAVSTGIQKDVRTSSLLTEQYDWIIETDTGIIHFNPLTGFTGKAKSIRGTGKTEQSTQSTDQSKENTLKQTTGENSTKVKEKSQKVIKESVKAVESKPSSKAITWVVLLVFLLVIAGLAYWKYQRRIASIL